MRAGGRSGLHPRSTRPACRSWSPARVSRSSSDLAPHRRADAGLTPGVHFDTDEYGRDVELTEAGDRLRRADRRLRQPARRVQPRAAHRRQLRAARARAAAARRRLPGSRRPDRRDRRAHGPRRRRSPLARRPAGRARGEGRPCRAARRPHPGIDHAAALPAQLSPPVRDDRHRPRRRGRTGRDLRPPGRGDSHSPAVDPRRSAGRHLRESRRERARRRRRGDAAHATGRPVLVGTLTRGRIRRAWPPRFATRASSVPCSTRRTTKRKRESSPGRAHTAR